MLRRELGLPTRGARFGGPISVLCSLELERLLTDLFRRRAPPGHVEPVPVPSQLTAAAATRRSS
jgi:hypothetical protein